MTNEIRGEVEDDRDIDGLFDDLQRNTWAGGNIRRSEIPRMVIIDADSFANLTASVTLHRWVFLVPGVAGVADVVYVCIKNTADAYEFLDISTPTTLTAGSSTSDLKDNMVANGLVTDGGATPLNLDSGKLTAGEVEIDGALNHDGSTVGFYGTTPIVKPTISGSRGGNVALATVCDVLNHLGLATDISTA